ncbi:MAG: Crp/Fnr family transcriptional regulator [Saprospiraceae bacterium]|nr:Crp/Fnr family transcriptional regulator [Saprospiraceae bacterium]
MYPLASSPSDTVVEALFDFLRGFQISAAALEKIRAGISVLQVKANTVLVKPGKVCHCVYFVKEGGFVCRYVNEAFEKEKTINFYLPDLHPFMACVDSYFTQTPTQCELRAVEDSVVLSMSKTAIDLLIQEDFSLRNVYDTLVIHALTEENELKLKIIAYTSEQLYDYILENLPSVIQKVPSKYIAEFMGISAEWLSKLKRVKK